MIRIKYIGKKPSAIDNVASTGKTWTGYGDVQEVPDRAARTLLRYPDQWALDDEGDRATVSKEPMTVFMSPDGAKVSLTDTELKKPLDRMSTDELRGYALKNHSHTFRPKTGRKSMIDEIEEMEKGPEPLVRR